MEKREKVWVPLEGNPHVFTEFAEKIGYPTALYKFYDVFDLSEEGWSVYIP